MDSLAPWQIRVQNSQGNIQIKYADNELVWFLIHNSILFHQALFSSIPYSGIEIIVSFMYIQNTSSTIYRGTWSLIIISLHIDITYKLVIHKKDFKAIAETVQKIGNVKPSN